MYDIFNILDQGLANQGEKKKKDSASQLFLCEYLDFMQCVSNSRRKILRTNIKVPHEFKNARYFQFSGWKGKIMHYNYFCSSIWISCSAC